MKPDWLYRERLRLVAHELFHRIQDSLGLPARSPNCNHLDRREIDACTCDWNFRLLLQY
ncbi:hypothetical protein Niako_0826 [Niastella koreensis GR20-10]|uniref:Uncharacterized protein n=1 Tax=Niastella koreensis (strain DSM 17620 / KACC 11465 / NBRC 106392 / GR20-10) TaxID=700598 RepID=G8TCZ8_NIAKG|nr:hypothetical protein Niako_0826 [Niastella koreensis GR20-10]